MIVGLMRTRLHLKPRKPNGRLTAKQATFCTEYLRDLNASAAARRAGFSARSASRLAVGLLQKRHVLTRIEELQAERIKRTQADADWVLKRLVEELDAKVADLYDENGALKPAKDWPEVWQRGLVTHVQTTILYGGTEKGKPKPIGEVKDVTFADRVKRIELLGRHIAVQAFKERVSIGTDAPLRALFEQIRGQSIRPASEMQTIEHQPEPETEGDD